MTGFARAPFKLLFAILAASLALRAASPQFASTLKDRTVTLGQDLCQRLPEASSPGHGRVRYQMVSNLPPGLAFDGRSRILAGTPQREGRWVLQYQALDSDGQSATATATLTVQKPSAALPALIGGFSSNAAISYPLPPVTVSSNKPVAFEGVSDGGTNPRWSFGDGGSANGYMVSHTFTSVGTFRVTFAVSADQTYAASSAWVNVNVVDSCTVNSLSVSPAAVTLPPGGTQLFTGTVVMDGSCPTGVGWSASGGTITSAGLYTAPATVGTYYVTATSLASGDVCAVATVAVASGSSNISTVTVVPSNPTLTVGGSQVFTATVVGSGNYSSAVTWSLVSGVGSIDTSTGSYTSAVTGTATVRATSTQDPTRYGQTSVTVNPPPSTITAVTLSPASATITVGGSQAFTATVTGTGSYDPTVVWSLVSGPGSLDAYGVYSSTVAGTAEVKATSVQDGTKSATAMVTVNSSSGTVTGVSVAPGSAAIPVDGSQTFTATVTGSGSYSTDVTWSVVSGPGSITASGVYTSSVSGTATVKATSVQDPTKSATASVTVTASSGTITSVTVSPATASIQVNTPQTFTAAVAGTGSFSTAVTWSVVSGVGTINASTGLYTSSTTGSATVKATSVQDPSKSGTAAVTVSATPQLRWRKTMVYGLGQLLSEESATGTVYIQSDQVGSPNILTNAAGAVVGRSKNLPFGERFSQTGVKSIRRFTNHEDGDGSAIYMQARTYLPVYGKFAQVDPVYDQTKDDPESWNLYNYVTNNPVTNTDPDGRAASNTTRYQGELVLDPSGFSDDFLDAIREYDAMVGSHTARPSIESETGTKAPEEEKKKPETKTDTSGQAGSASGAPADTGAAAQSNQEAIAVLQQIANSMQGMSGQVLVMGWDWKSLGIVGQDHSVGHIAAAVANGEGGWTIVQSQFPHAPGGNSAPLGPNTTIANPSDLRAVEGGRKPNFAYLVTVPNLGAFAKAAIQDLKQPHWYLDPQNFKGSTNCTYGVIQSLRAGGVPLSGLWANKSLLDPRAPYLPRDLRNALSREVPFNVIHNYKIHQRNDLINKIDWGN